MASLSHWRRRLNLSLFTDPGAREILDPRRIEDLCREAGHRWRDSFWSPALTVLTFLLQVLSAEKTLRAAVASLLARLAAQGFDGRPVSGDPRACCQARRRLPRDIIGRPGAQVADRMHALLGDRDRWRGHRLMVVDGTTVSMPDEPGLRRAFPRPTNQRGSCAFPVARLVTVFWRATGAVLRTAIGHLGVSELSLLREHAPQWFRPGDVMLADRCYGSYADLVRLRLQGVFVICRQHQRRPGDMRRGRRLGPEDRLMLRERPPGMDPFLRPGPADVRGPAGVGAFARKPRMVRART